MRGARWLPKCNFYFYAISTCRLTLSYDGDDIENTTCQTYCQLPHCETMKIPESKFSGKLDLEQVLRIDLCMGCPIPLF